MGGIAASGSSMFNSASSAEASLNKITWTFLIFFNYLLFYIRI